MKRNWFVTVLFSFIMCATLLGCNQNEGESTANEKLSVVTSFYPMYEFTQQVAGDRADVSLMVSAGEDAHHYEPSAQDVAGVNEAEVLVYSSEEMEHWVESLLNTVENDDLVIVRTADGVDLVNTEGSDHDHDHEDEENQEAIGNINIQGVADHYHTGDMIGLTAELDEDVEYDHWHWYTRESADEEWATVPDQGGPEFEYEASGESFELRAVLFDGEHNEYAASEPVEIVIDDHDGDDHDHSEEEHDHNHGEEGGHDHEHGQDEESGQDNENGTGTIEIAGLADHYHTGDVVTLVAQLDENIEYDHWHWFTRESEDEQWEVVSGQQTDHFEYETTGESFEVKAVLYDNDHNTYAESEPVSIIIDDHESHDPHIWLDPVLAQEQVNVIRDALIEADPDGKEIYEENAEAFNEELQALDEEYQAKLGDAENRAFVVQHQAFGYLANRYNLEQIAIGGLSTEVEPSPSRIAEIANLVEEHDVPVIYYQQGANSAIAETVATETGTETAAMYDLEVLSEELQAEDLGYVDAMRQNLEALQLSVQ
ncbi:metal ABC transporter solute-binding protein, Zn/Mn family [Gracilibacillus lacisalsi]|uniref:metal ABC transporter solute-binding protein, Zn/Mn family n=1 Tax=Gracilibacillus lacisalsi TaxID=393087 RepID=UPI00036907AC|nr:zinc ABC transporter substrate-binding protein [Gracilibacillus lacisalsi]